jgi:hypothetical protein
MVDLRLPTYQILTRLTERERLAIISDPNLLPNMSLPVTSPLPSGTHYDVITIGAAVVSPRPDCW